MKKLLIISSIMMVGLCSFAGAPQPKRTAEGSALKNIIQEFVTAGSKKYTKKTEIKLNTTALEEAKNYFHCQANAAQRRTYYDESEEVDALLMGDYAGGFATINSGYAKNGANMEHYTYADAATPNASTLFTARTPDYTVDNTSPSQFFVTLSALAVAVEGKTFTVNAGVYEYAVGPLSKDGEGNYTDALLQKVQFFAAPMLLQSVGSAYLTPTKLTFEAAGDDLSIKMYVSEGDEYKLVDGANQVLAEAVVKKGLILN